MNNEYVTFTIGSYIVILFYPIQFVNHYLSFFFYFFLVLLSGNCYNNLSYKNHVL